MAQSFYEHRIVAVADLVPYGRSCRASEIEPRYVDVAVRRWQVFAGGVATLEGDGRTFAELEAERVPAKKAA